MVKIKETAGTKTYSCEWCGENFFSLSLTEKHEKWECSQAPEETVTDDIEEEATDEEGDSGEMKPKYTKLDEGEQLIENPIECNMSNSENKDTVRFYATNYSPPAWNWNAVPGLRMVTMFITDKRIILEDNSSETVETAYSFLHDDIATTEGRNAGLIAAGNLSITLFDSMDFECMHVKNGGKLSEKLNRKFYPKYSFDNPHEKRRVSNRRTLIQRGIAKAKHHEKLLEFDEAAEIYKELEMDDELIRIRKLKSEQGAVKVTQKVVHGDEITKTEIKDSVVSKSNIGGGSSKMQELKELTEMKKEGLIDDDEFKQMKKEILGK